MQYLRGVNFPISKDGLIQKARQNGAPDEVIQMLDGLQGDQYKNMQEVASQFAQQK